MHTKTRFLHILSSALLLTALLLGVMGFNATSTLAAGPITSTACTGTGTVTCELWVKSGGTLSLPGGTVTVWGYANSAAGPAQVPGPVLIANQGENLTVVIHNDLTVTTSMKFEGQEMPADLTGVTAGGMKSYTLNTSRPGIYLYEAGPLPGAQYQAAMGMYGALIIRSATAGQAYNNLASAYDDEALVMLSEIDPALNNSATPANFDMRQFKPKYFLINGKAYPGTDIISAPAGNQLLLRYVNAGQQTHTMALLGVNQTFLSLAGVELPNYRTGASQLLMPGQSADAIVTVPATAIAQAKIPLYEAGAMLHNNGNQAFGGMLTFLEVAGSVTPGDALGPVASGLALSENPTNGSTNVTLSASISDAGRGDAAVQTAEYCVDAPGSGCLAMSASDLAYDDVTENVQVTLTSTYLTNTLSSGVHTLYVRGQDVNANWGPYNSIVLTLDKTGPATTGIVQSPAVTNGTVAVNISATGNDTATGNANVTAGQYRIDGGLIQAMNAVASPAPIVSLNATISAATMSALSAGNHNLEIRSSDSLGNQGAWATATLVVDKAGPTTSNMKTTPLATNGTASVRVDALVTDLVVKVTNAEMFIDNSTGAPGTGLAMYSKDGAYDELGEDVYANITQAQANALTAGAHTVYVRGKDAAGNWGGFGMYTLISDKVKPIVSGVSATPNPTNTTVTPFTSNSTFTLSANSDGTGTNIIQAEWYEAANTALGKGNQFTFTAGPTVGLSATINYVALGWTPGNHTVYVRAKDAANNWSSAVSVIVNVVYPNAVFSDGFETGNFSAWSATGGTAAQISVSSGNAQAGTYKMAAAISGGASGYVQNNAPVVDVSYHARFYLNPNNLSYTNNGNATTARTVFLGLSATSQNVFQVQMRRTSTTGNFEVRALVYRAGGGGGVSTTNWYQIPNNAYTAIEIDWSSAASAAFRFYTGGTIRQTFTGINTSAYTLDSVRLGPQGALGGVSGTLFLDSFASTRRTYIGP